MIEHGHSSCLLQCGESRYRNVRRGSIRERNQKPKRRAYEYEGRKIISVSLAPSVSLFKFSLCSIPPPPPVNFHCHVLPLGKTKIKLLIVKLFNHIIAIQWIVFSKLKIRKAKQRKKKENIIQWLWLDHLNKIFFG